MLNNGPVCVCVCKCIQSSVIVYIGRQYSTIQHHNNKCNYWSSQEWRSSEYEITLYINIYVPVDVLWESSNEFALDELWYALTWDTDRSVQSKEQCSHVWALRSVGMLNAAREKSLPLYHFNLSHRYYKNSQFRKKKHIFGYYLNTDSTLEHAIFVSFVVL